MPEQGPVKYATAIPDVLAALSDVHKTMSHHKLDRHLQHLVQLRASQINQCGYCIKMHTQDARRDGETSERLDRLIAWRQVDDFTAAEKAAFAWTEALTSLDKPSDLSAIRADLREHFSDEEIGVLTADVAMINLWNRIQISAH